MLKHKFVPDDVSVGVIISLVKDADGDTGKSKNYKGVTLGPVESKVFEMCMLEKYFVFLQSSSLQFGFKTNSGCANAISCLMSATEYFNNNGSTVSPCALDIAKAFNKTNHYALYIELLRREVLTSLILILMNWYDKC